MTQKHLLKHFAFITLVAILISFASCASKQVPLSEDYNAYPGTVFFNDGEALTGIVKMPKYNSEEIRFVAENDDVEETFQASEIERVEFNVMSLSQDFSRKTNVMRYMPTKGFFGNVGNQWSLLLAEGEYASAYIAANNYTINHDGSVSLGGVRQTMSNGSGGMTIINPSFPVYIIKEGETALTNVAVKEGVSFEGSAFRSGVSRYLADDVKLCEYMRRQKWEFEHIKIIVEHYNPHRGKDELILFGEVIETEKQGLITNDFDKEMLFYVETAMPTDTNYGTQFGIGIRTSNYKYLAWGADLGYASARYIDGEKRVHNHIGNWVDAPVIDADFSQSGLFRFNAFIGGQLPFNRKIYILYLLSMLHSEEWQARDTMRSFTGRWLCLILVSE